MSWPTASKLYLARVCPSSYALPHLDVRTEHAEAGIARHAEDERDINAGNVPEALAERWPGLSWSAEVAFAYHLETGKGRVLGNGIDRDYSGAQPGEVCGTADAVGVGDGRLVVVDRKSFEEVERAAINAQLHIAALALSSAWGLDAVEVAIRYEARPMDVAALDAFDLDTFASELRTIIGGVEHARKLAARGEALALVEGAHCKHCPALLACPLKRQLAADVEQRVEIAASGKLLFALDDDDEAARAYEFAERAGQLIGKLKAALAARAKERPIPIGGGKMYGLVPRKGNDKLDADKLYDLVRERHGQGIADAAVIRTATKKRLSEALAFAGVASKAAAERELLKELRARGGVSREDKMTLDEYPAALGNGAGAVEGAAEMDDSRDAGPRPPMAGPSTSEAS